MADITTTTGGTAENASDKGAEDSKSKTVPGTMNASFVSRIPAKLCCSGTMVGSNTLNQNYLLLRCIFMLYSVCLLFWTFFEMWFDFNALSDYFTYMTHWNMFLNTGYFVSSFYLNFSIYKQFVMNHTEEFEHASIDSLGLRKAWNVAWYCLNTSLGLSFFIITLFWLLIYDGTLHVTTWQTHGLLGGMIIVDWLTSTWHLSYWGSVTALLTVLVWVLFSLIFYVSGARNRADGGRYIYPAVDWGAHPWVALGLCLCVLFFVPLFHLMLVCIKNQLLKRWIKRATQKQKDQLIELESAMQRNHDESAHQTIETNNDVDQGVR